MARFLISRPAQADLTQILASSAERWRIEARRRYTALLAAAMRRVAAEPEGPTTKNRSEIARGIRSFHLRHARVDKPEAKVRRPVHVLYYRVVRSGLVEIVRVLHERMEPSRYIDADAE
jgi:toxin ParE1/3/4